MAEKYYAVSPYAYCNNNPGRFVDQLGMDIYRYDDASRQMILYEHNNDEYDQIGRFKKDKKSGEYTLVTKRNGTAKTRLDNIEKGILSDGMDFSKDNHVVVESEGRPSLEGVQNFLLGFSNMIDKEVGGYYLSPAGENKISHVTIGKINNNTAKNAIPGGPFSSFSNTTGFNSTAFDVKVNYHTHLSKFDDQDRLRPSSMSGNGGDIGFKNRQLQNNPNLKFLIITNPTPFYY